ncbi:stringent starvation protein B [Ventosimonas gracilis]|uniref:Stringent starvation protein B n=1 Tax=Ventosimonas gracilis TaxID=1680762 RepID=A0A139SXX6_9GAMM|nr:ClpXP protease specificity-enhancing factor [Ventosimonas gracilis]KXU39449.1 stringent starvation protein B [Ventosimonas gracilis]
MTSSRPYIIRALYEWILDNNCTPHILVNAEYAGIQIPAGFTKNGQITLNLSPSAVRHLHADNEALSFEGRFAGVAYRLYIPVGAVLAIYAREDGQGMAFNQEPAPTPTDEDPPPTDKPPRPSGRPTLRVVK